MAAAVLRKDGIPPTVRLHMHGLWRGTGGDCRRLAGVAPVESMRERGG